MNEAKSSIEARRILRKERDCRIVKMRQDGFTHFQISQEFNIAISHVAYILKKSGLMDKDNPDKVKRKQELKEKRITEAELLFESNKSIMESLNNNVRNKMCSMCNTDQPITNFRTRLSRGKREINPRCITCNAKYLKAYRAEHLTHENEEHLKTAKRIRLEGISAYGGKCACCGIDIVEFLTLDHVDGRSPVDFHSGGGAKTGKSAWGKARQLGWPPEYQVLCFNCNIAKGRYGECPHTKKIKKVRDE